MIFKLTLGLKFVVTDIIARIKILYNLTLILSCEILKLDNILIEMLCRKYQPGFG